MEIQEKYNSTQYKELYVHLQITLKAPNPLPPQATAGKASTKFQGKIVNWNLPASPSIGRQRLADGAAHSPLWPSKARQYTPHKLRQAGNLASGGLEFLLWFIINNLRKYYMRVIPSSYNCKYHSPI